MNIKSAVFGMVCIKPQTIRDIKERLPYAPDSIYNAVEIMVKDGKIVKIKTDSETRLDITKDYKNQKLKEFFIKSLSYGADPEILLRSHTLCVWRSLDLVTSVSDLIQKTHLSEKSVRKFLKILSNYGLVHFKKSKPISASKVKDHPLNVLLGSIVKENEAKERIYASGSSPFEEIVTTPDEIEKMLYEKIDESLAIKKTGFMVRGKKGKLSILESVATKQSLEDFFISKVMTPEGAEDICIKILASKRMNYEVLLRRAVENTLVNQIGCYLDIINDMKRIVPSKMIEKFSNTISDKTVVFLKDEKRYGKSGWEQKYEKKWNVDLYLDIGAIEHGVRSI